MAFRLYGGQPAFLAGPRDRAAAARRMRTGQPAIADRWADPAHGSLAVTGWRNDYLRQSGSCVWFAGFSHDTGSPGGEGTVDWTNAFFGKLASDFTVRGSWADLPWGDDSGIGEITWRITFAEVEGFEGVTLQVVDVRGGFGARFLVRPETRADVRVRIRDADGCLSFASEDGTDMSSAPYRPTWESLCPSACSVPTARRSIPQIPSRSAGRPHVVPGSAVQVWSSLWTASNCQPAPEETLVGGPQALEFRSGTRLAGRPDGSG
ncbi:MAG: hypothetical protein ACRDFR_09625 [Candidatus Limnocylindria bacterium]